MENVILVGVFKKSGDQENDQANLEELERLTETAGGVVADTVTQQLERFHSRSLIGSGKVKQVAHTARAHRAHTVIFDENLSPAQQLYLEREIGAKIVDRTRLILDIFSQRARTKEGELQVELAQLSYMLPRLTGSWRAFSQQVGGIGTRGPGERKLEYERRHIQSRIERLKREIRRMEKNRSVQRHRRQAVPMPSVAIIGYTNAGKSSLLNKLTLAAGRSRHHTVYADDKLFATLDPTTRRIRLPEGGWAVFTDTVGFISKLPTTLIAAFRSTLEEVARADCLLHLEDGTTPYSQRQRNTVREILKSLGAQNVPCISAVNKADLLAPEARERVYEENPDRPIVSAKTGVGIGALLTQIQTELNKRWLLRELSLSAAQSAHLNEIYQCAQVLSQKARKDRILLKLRVTQENWQRLLKKRFTEIPKNPL